MNTETFHINLFIYCEYFSVTQEDKDSIYAFLISEQKFMQVIELYEQLAATHTDVFYPDRLIHRERWKENFLSFDDQVEMYNQIRRAPIYEDNPDTYSCANRKNFYYSPGHEGRPIRIITALTILNLPFDLTYSNPNHKPIFARLFASMLSQTSWPEEFLQHHLDNAFQSNHSEYKQFLTLVVGDHQALIDHRIDFLQLWIANKLNGQETSKVKSDYTNRILTVKQYAIMHHYLQETGEEPLFEKSGKTKENCIQELASKYNISPHTFTQKYNQVHSDPAGQSIADLQAVFDFLPPNSKAKLLVRDKIRIDNRS